jgi:DNA-binding beta-propeller fold protein YncE
MRSTLPRNVTKGRRGDWDESKGQRLLWEPVAMDFGPNGDIYIFSSHADESPNDIDSGDPTNNIGLSRVLRLDKTGKFISQWFGSDNGPGKFYMGHGSAVDPVTGDVWVGDRQNYRIVIFNAEGHFLRTISMRNLPSALFFNKRKGPNFGDVWLATGQDGQVLKLDRDGNVMGAIGSRKSTAPNHFSEAAYMGINSKGRLYVGDSQVARVTELIPPAQTTAGEGGAAGGN